MTIRVCVLWELNLIRSKLEMAAVLKFRFISYASSNSFSAICI